MSDNFDRNALLLIAADGYSKTPFFEFDQKAFEKDVRTFFITRKMLKRFLKTGNINDKLIINNIIICLNIFGISKTNIIFRTICEDVEFGVVKACLIFLNSYSLSDKTPQNQTMKDILSDITHRYHLQPREDHNNEISYNSLHNQPPD